MSTLNPLEYGMSRDEFMEHMNEAGGELISTDADGRETWACCYVGKSCVCGVFCPVTESAELPLI